MHHFQRFGLWNGLLTLALTASVLIGTPGHAAADHGELNASELISDERFVDTNAMSVDDIQRFLVTRGSFLKEYSQDGRSAAQIIYDAAQGSGGASSRMTGLLPSGERRSTEIRGGTVNPQVLLVTLEKEQSLLSMTQPSDNALRVAMGYGCPDWGGCYGDYAGFTKQVEAAALQLRYNFERADGLGFEDFQVGQSFCFADEDGRTNCGTFGNRATASLYRYTPHVYTGGHNFDMLFKRWFSEWKRPETAATAPLSLAPVPSAIATSPVAVPSVVVTPEPLKASKAEPGLLARFLQALTGIPFAQAKS